MALMCIALVGCGDKGGDFVGTWENNEKPSETITVTKTNNGYRTIAILANNPDHFFNMEVMLVAESDTLLVMHNTKRRALELNKDGTMTSFLREGTKVLTRVK